MTLRKQISLAMVGLFVAGIIIMMLITDWVIRHNLQDNFLEQMKIQTLLVDRILPADTALARKEVLDLSAKTGTRITIIDIRGGVLMDCDHGQWLNTEENHLNRPEVADALRSAERFGSSLRRSATLDKEMMYAVYYSPQNRFVRLAHEQLFMDSLLSQIRWLYLFSAIVIISLILFATHKMAQTITRPIQHIIDSAKKIQSGQYEASFEVRSKNEIRELADILNAMAEKLKMDIEQLKRLQEIRKDFVANASHELRTPVSSIRGYIETLLDGALEDEEVSRRFLERTLSNIHRLEVIIEDMLDLSQLEKRDKQLSLRTIDVRTLLSDLKLDFEKTAEHKGLLLLLNLQSPPGFRLLADPYQFEKAMMNLIDNAIKYTEKGTITISDRLIDGYYEVSVADTGTGIRAEDIPRIFERFYRADKHRSRQLGGSGLGLAIVKHIMELHNGSVRVESEYGKGSEFVLRFNAR